MNGWCGVFFFDLDLIMVLGIEVRMVEECCCFVELFVQQDFKCVEVELVFQWEVDVVWKWFYFYILLIGVGMGSVLVQFWSYGCLVLFVKVDCLFCDKMLMKLFVSQKLFDIYLVGSEGQDVKVCEWVSRWYIFVECVKMWVIMFNYDVGCWLKLGKG